MAQAVPPCPQLQAQLPERAATYPQPLLPPCTCLQPGFRTPALLQLLSGDSRDPRPQPHPWRLWHYGPLPHPGSPTLCASSDGRSGPISWAPLALLVSPVQGYAQPDGLTPLRISGPLRTLIPSRYTWPSSFPDVGVHQGVGRQKTEATPMKCTERATGWCHGPSCSLQLNHGCGAHGAAGPGTGRVLGGCPPLGNSWRTSHKQLPVTCTPGK